jgi:6-phosphogluconolactonase
MTIEVLPTEQYTERAVAYLAERIQSREAGKPYHIFLSGGSTPRPIYRGLADSGLDWSQVHFWLGDERYVPWDHPDSNYRMVREALLDPAGIPSDQVHPWPILSTPELSAETYDREFRAVFVRDGQPLNLQILGMGDDGHTASLFPGSPALGEKEAMCVSNLVDAAQKNRLTLTFAALALSLNVVFLVKGAGKAGVLKEVVEMGLHPSAQAGGQRSTVFVIDQEAAGQLTSDRAE